MNYTRYQLSKKEYAENIVVFLVLDGMISYLFYRSWIVFLLCLPCLNPFLKMRRENLCQKRREKLEEQFLMAMQTVITSLTAGYSVETAFTDALKNCHWCIGRTT